MSAEARKHARQLLLKEYRGVLSTHSQAMPGFPFGSVVPYCLDARGWPLLLISRIAQHTRNLKADARCSLLVGERAAEDVQAAGAKPDVPGFPWWTLVIGGSFIVLTGYVVYSGRVADR